MKLNKLQRHTAYILMLVEINKRPLRYGGFCEVINDVFDLDVCEPYKTGFPNFRETFPEIMNKITRDEVQYVFLFSNWGERKTALEQCIKETA